MTLVPPIQLLLAQAAQVGEVGSGKITGGWEYVWAAYLVFWLALALYAGGLLTRRNQVRHGGEG